MKTLIKNINLRLDHITICVFALFAFFIPMQKQWHKLFDQIGERLASSKYPFAEFFANKIQFSNADLFILCLVLLSIKKIRASSSSTLSKWLMTALIGYLSCSFLSILVSNQKDYLAIYFIFVRYAFFWLLYWLLSFGLVDRSYQKISTIFLTSTSLSSFLQASISIGQYFKQYSLGLKRLGETSFARSGKMPVGFGMEKVSLWLFGKEYPAEIKHTIYRSYGTFAHPNILGWYLAMGILATLYLLAKVETKKGKIALYIAMFIQTFALFTSYSRSALLGLIFSLSLSFIIKKKNDKAPLYYFIPFLCILISTILLLPQLKERSHYFSVFPLLLVYVASILGGIFLGASLCWICRAERSNMSSLPSLKKRWQYKAIASAFFLYLSLSKISYIKESILKLTDLPRLINPLVAFKMIMSHPLLGVGFSLYTMNMKDFLPPSVTEDVSMLVHNIFLMVAAESGIIGLLCFMMLIFVPAFHILKKRRDLESFCLLAMLATSLFVGMCDMHFLVFVHGRLFFFSLLGIIALGALQKDDCIEEKTT